MADINVIFIREKLSNTSDGFETLADFYLEASTIPHRGDYVDFHANLQRPMCRYDGRVTDVVWKYNVPSHGNYTTVQRVEITVA